MTTTTILKSLLRTPVDMSYDYKVFFSPTTEQYHVTIDAIDESSNTFVEPVRVVEEMYPVITEAISDVHGHQSTVLKGVTSE